MSAECQELVGPNLTILAGRLEFARIYRGLSRTKLAQRAGYTKSSTLDRYEKPGAVACPHPEIVHRFADALGCDVLWLSLGRGSPNWDPSWKS